MIPLFPVFKPLSWSDKHDIEYCTTQFPPYSDFNIASLYSWNFHAGVQISQLHSNLVVIFRDYVTAKPFVSFIGTTAVSETAHALLQYSDATFQEPSLKLVPAITAQALSGEFLVMEDINAHDYIMSAEFVSSFRSISTSGNSAIRSCKKYFELYTHDIVRQPASDLCMEMCDELFRHWAYQKNLTATDLPEYKAFQRYKRIATDGHKCITIFDEKALIGFSAYEIVSPEYAIVHFSKALKGYTGLYDGLNYCEALYTHKDGVRYINWEQDLGIVALRYAKKKYQPAFYLKKFTIQKK